MVEGDVRNARQAMNLSHWTDYPPEERQSWLREVPPLIQNRLMPLPRYILIHRDSKLSNDDIRIVSEWAKTERNRLRPAPIEDGATHRGAGSSAE